MKGDRFQRTPTGNLIPCPEFFHDIEIKDCFVCDNTKEVKEFYPIDFEKVKLSKDDISILDINDNQMELAKSYIANSEAYWYYTKYEILLRWLDEDVDLSELG